MTLIRRRPCRGENVFVLCCVFFVGCQQATENTQPLATQQEDASSFGVVASAEEELPKEVLRVEPGTKLTEAAFTQTLRDTGAKFIIVQVYMEACGPCMTEALHLTEKQDAWRKSGVAVLGLGMDDTPDGPQAFYRHTGERITFPLYMARGFLSSRKSSQLPRYLFTQRMANSFFAQIRRRRKMEFWSPSTRNCQLC